jgi:hypothetical protein
VVNRRLCRKGSRPNSALRSGNISAIRILEVTMTFLPNLAIAELQP